FAYLSCVRSPRPLSPPGRSAIVTAKALEGRARVSFEELVGRRAADAQAAAASREDRETALRRQYDSAKPLAHAAFLNTVRQARDYLAEQSAYDMTLDGGTGWYLGEHEKVRAFISTDGQLHFGNVHTFAGHWSPVGEFKAPTTAWMLVSGSNGPVAARCDKESRRDGPSIWQGCEPVHLG
ncbi:hypothetical protein SAMN04489738_0785, partial [Pseudarthrobacter chlorophenolicus]